jgi:hypothetical protein
MGLDMYLKLNRARSENIANVEDVKDLESLFDKVIVTVKEEFTIGYWRKANAIHNFIDLHCCNGQLENCTDVRVSVEQLETLIHYCKIVLADNTLAEELLPTQDGFFFGPTDYDDWYFKNLQRTIDMCEPVLNFIYSLSDEDQLNYRIIYNAWW